MMIKIYGIKNCDTMKKALRWLDENAVPYDFHDYKKLRVPEEMIRQAFEQLGWETVINRKSTTWRQLPDDVKESMDRPLAIQTALENPSIIKRPLLNHDGQFMAGFSPDDYAEIFK